MHLLSKIIPALPDNNMNKEFLSIPDQIDRVVANTEDKIIEKLRAWDKSAEKRSAGCKCAHCQAELKRADEALVEELPRQFFDGDGDEEEAWIMGLLTITPYQQSKDMTI